MQRHFTSRPLQQLLAASAVFLAVGGSAFAQTTTPAPSTAPVAPAVSPSGAAPAPSAEQGAPHHGGKHRHGDHARHHGHHGHHGAHGAMFMKSVDTDGDGAISKAESDAFFNKIDANKDGKLDRAEMSAYRKAQHEQHRAEMRQRFDARFKAADKDADGALSKQEAQAGMPRLANRFDQLDGNHDGKLTQQELASGMQKVHQQRMQRGNGNTPSPAVPSTRGG
jgi:Ca2+-binding EF-hand superfamily protein